MRFFAVLATLFLAGPITLTAHEGEQDVVPEAEREKAREMRAEGPDANQGIAGIEKLGMVSLAKEFENTDGRVLRTRELTILPDGVVAVHRHEGRPGLAYILEGEIVEHRNDRETPQVHGVGSVAFEKTGVMHWWENRGDKPVRALVVDIVPEE